jgi:hypothetical protein
VAFAAYAERSADLGARIGGTMRILKTQIIVVIGCLGVAGCSAHRGAICDPRPPEVGRIVSETIGPMCAAELSWGPAVVIVFVTDPSGATARNASVCAWSSQTGKVLHAKADASGVVHLAVQGEDVYQLKVSQPGYRAFFARQVKTKPGCVTWVHAVTDIPAISG